MNIFLTRLKGLHMILHLFVCLFGLSVTQLTPYTRRNGSPLGMTPIAKSLLSDANASLEFSTHKKKTLALH